MTLVIWNEYCELESRVPEKLDGEMLQACVNFASFQQSWEAEIDPPAAGAHAIGDGHTLLASVLQTTAIVRVPEPLGIVYAEPPLFRGQPPHSSLLVNVVSPAL